MAGNIAEVEAVVDSRSFVEEVGHMGHMMDNTLAVGGIGDGEAVPAVEVPAVGVWSFGEVEDEQEVAVLVQLQSSQP